MKGHRYWVIFSLAWLLWVHGYSLKHDGTEETWSVDSTYQTKEDCETAAVRLAANYEFYIKERWNLKGKREYKQYCYTQDVNPREVTNKSKEEPKEGAQ